MKRLITFTISLIVCTALVMPVFAINIGTDLVDKAAVDVAGYDTATDTTFAEMVGTVIKAALSMVGVLFTFLIAWAGNMRIMARGNEEEITKANKIIVGSILGLVITLAAYTLSNFAVNAILERATGQ